MKISRSLFLAPLLAANLLAQQIMPQYKINNIESLLPQVDSVQIDSALKDSSGIWYDRESMGIAYQIGAGQDHSLPFSSTGRLGIANALLNISNDAPESQKKNGFGGNLNGLDNGSYPWNPVPGGTHRSPNVSSIKKFLLPKNSLGETYPVVTTTTQLEGFNSPLPTVTGVDWVFPVGTIFIEPITVNNDETKQHYVCIIRVRIKSKDGWVTQSYCPARTAEELSVIIKQLRPNYTKDEQLTTFISYLQDQRTLADATLIDNTPGNPAFSTRRGDAFKSSAKIDNLPELPSSLIADILDSTLFREASGYEWKLGCNAPTTDSDFHIVPKKYDGAFISIDSHGCTQCHNSTQISARKHSAVNQKYGWVRGNREGIISWHPFDPASLTREANPNIKFRQEWLDAGIIAYYDPEKHPVSLYGKVKK